MYNLSIFFMVLSCLTLGASIICLYLVIIHKYHKTPKYKDPFTKDYCLDGCTVGVCTPECKLKKKCCKHNSDCQNCKDRISGIYYRSPIKTPKIKKLSWKEKDKLIKLENDKIKTLNEDIRANNKFSDNRLSNI